MYSLDFRRRIFNLRKEEKLTFAQTAARFKVCISTLIRWARCIEPKLTRDKPAVKLDMELLRQDVEKHPDAYLRERATRLGVSISGVGHALKRLGVTRKKKLFSSTGKRTKTIYILPKN